MGAGGDRVSMGDGRTTEGWMCVCVRARARVCVCVWRTFVASVPAVARDDHVVDRARDGRLRPLLRRGQHDVAGAQEQAARHLHVLRAADHERSVV